MSRQDNYAIMLEQARQLFLTYDQSAIIAKTPLTFDETHLYLPVLGRTVSIHRSTGQPAWPSGAPLAPHDAMTVYDYLCDAKPDRHLSGQFRSLTGFGHQFHTGLVEQSQPTALERFIDTHPDAFRSACEALRGSPYPKGDIGCVLPLFPDFPVLLQFWHADEDFPPQLRFFFDSNALSWLRYETMHYARNLILSCLSALIDLPNKPSL